MNYPNISLHTYIHTTIVRSYVHSKLSYVHEKAQKNELLHYLKSIDSNYQADKEAKESSGCGNNPATKTKI